MNEPYFKNLPHLGSLYLKSIYLFFEEPILFLCTNEQGIKFLCLCSELRDEYRWIIANVNNKLLKRLISNEISTYEMFRQTETPKYIVKWSGYESDKEIVSCVDFKDIPKLDLPEQNIFLDLPQSQQAELLQDLQSYTVIFRKNIALPIRIAERQNLNQSIYFGYSLPNCHWNIGRSVAV